MNKYYCYQLLAVALFAAAALLGGNDVISMKVSAIILLVSVLLYTFGAISIIRYNKKKAAYKLMFAAAFSDGDLSKEEIEQLNKFAVAKRVPQEVVDEISSEINNKKQYLIPIPNKKRDKIYCLECVGEMIKADSVITEEEEKYFKNTGKLLGLDEKKVNEMFAKL